jgi:hypothetical protein
VPTTCYQVGFAVVLRKKEKKTLNLSLPILVMEGRNLKKVHTTQNISAKNYVDCRFAFEFGYKRKTRSA